MLTNSPVNNEQHPILTSRSAVFNHSSVLSDALPTVVETLTLVLLWTGPQGLHATSRRGDLRGRSQGQARGGVSSLDF